MPPPKSKHVHFDGDKIKNKLVAKRIGLLLLSIGVAYIAGICYYCFKATVTFKGVAKNYVCAQDAYMLMGNKVMKWK